MTTDTIVILGTVFAIIVAIAWFMRFLPKPKDEDAASLLARTSPSGRPRRMSEGVVFFALLMLLGSGVSLAMFMSATNAVQEMIGLVMWVGNCCFWASFMIVAAIAHYSRQTE